MVALARGVSHQVDQLAEPYPDPNVLVRCVVACPRVETSTDNVAGSSIGMSGRCCVFGRVVEQDEC